MTKKTKSMPHSTSDNPGNITTEHGQ